MTIFEKDEDYVAFEAVLTEAVARSGIRLLSYCVMPNHWHIVAWPKQDGQLSDFTVCSVTHTMRWHAHYDTGGTGHLYQGRFKSFPIQSDGHLLTVMRYVERNPVRSNSIELAEEWHWSSAYARRRAANEGQWLATPSDPSLPRNWRSWVNRVESDAELTSLRNSVRRGLPSGNDHWNILDCHGFKQAKPRNERHLLNDRC